MGIDLETLRPRFSVDGRIAHGGYCGPAVKPIALHMASQIATDPETRGLPISGIGGISNWADAVEFMLLGASSVQLCTAVMHYGFRIIEELEAGLEDWMERKGFKRLGDFIGKAAPSVVDWKKLNLHHKTVAVIDGDKCISCELCYVACNDSAHQCIDVARHVTRPHVTRPPHGGASSGGDKSRLNRIPHVVEEDCVGCNLCAIVCPVEGCITMKEVKTASKPLSWEEYTARGMKGYQEVYKRMHG